MYTVNENRHNVRLFNIIITVSVLVLAVKLSDGSFAGFYLDPEDSISRIVQENGINFTELPDEGDYKYVSDVSFNPKAMAGYYTLTTGFMDSVLSKDFDPDAFIKIENNVVQFKLEDWQAPLRRFSGILTVVVILLILAILLLIGGLCFCVCRCCGRCGAHSQPIDKDKSRCSKIILATLLVCSAALLMFGVACIFASNEEMNKGVKNLKQNLDNSIDDIDTYLTLTSKQIETLLDTNYREFSSNSVDIMNKSIDTIYNNLLVITDFDTTNLVIMMNNLPGVDDDLNQIITITTDLRNYTLQLNDALRGEKEDLTTILVDLDTLCQTGICDTDSVRGSIESIPTDISFNALPDVSTAINQLADLDLPDLQRTVNESLDNITDTIKTYTNSSLFLAQEQLDSAGSQIRNGSDQIQKVILDLQSQIRDKTHPTLQTTDDYIKEYVPYFYDTVLVLNCILLVIILCLALALVFGICGKTPGRNKNACCSKATGSSFLITAVVLIFIVGFIFSVVTIAAFLIGMVAQRVVCDPLKDPVHSKVFHLIDQIDFSDYRIDFKVSEAWASCRENQSIYETFRLESQFNLTVVESYVGQISDALGNMSASDINFEAFKIITDERKDNLKNLVMEFEKIKLDGFKEQLESALSVTGTLAQLLDEIKTLTESIENIPGTDETVRKLNDSQLHLKTYDERLVQPIVADVEKLTTLVENLEEKLIVNNASFGQTITETLAQVEEIENQLTGAGQDLVKNATKEFTDAALDLVKSYIYRVTDKTKYDIGKCGPISLAIDGTVTSICDKILLPWNGFWFGMFWTLLVFVPTIIIAGMLATTYKKYHPVAEADLSYDALDRYRVPYWRNGSLDRKGKKKKRKGDKNHPNSNYENPQYPIYGDAAPKSFQDDYRPKYY